MREIGFSQLWPKLAKSRFTTFRLARRDKDWAVDEIVKVVFKPRSRDNRSVLGQAVIVAKVPKQVWRLTKAEAITDGFAGIKELLAFLNAGEPNTMVNKLTLAWQQIWVYVPEQKEHIAKEWATLLGKDAPQLSIYGKRPQYIIHQDVLYAFLTQFGQSNLTIK